MLRKKYYQHDEVFARIRGLLRKAYGEKAEEMSMRLFPVILTDNGTEFTDPAGIENDEQGRAQTSLFYCDACQSWQKAHVERNHELLRKVLPKGTAYTEPTSFDGLTQEQVARLLSHVNGYVRKSIGDRTPWNGPRGVCGAASGRRGRPVAGGAGRATRRAVPCGRTRHRRRPVPKRRSAKPEPKAKGGRDA